MIMIKSLTPLIKYEKLKLENHFYEMLTATVSHDMRTPLNAMLGLINSIGTFITD
jgi:signal transduction histidine kinase